MKSPMSAPQAPAPAGRQRRPVAPDEPEAPPRELARLSTFREATEPRMASEGLLKRLQRLTGRVGELKGEEPPPRPAPVVHERPTSIFD